MEDKKNKKGGNKSPKETEETFKALTKAIFKGKPKEKQKKNK